MNSGYYKAMADKFEALKTDLGGLYAPIDACVASITTNEPAMENNIISGNPLDDGKLTEAKGEISSISGDIGTMQAECDEKYAYWYALYEEALRRETEEAEKNKRWWQ